MEIQMIFERLHPDVFKFKFIPCLIKFLFKSRDVQMHPLAPNLTAPFQRCKMKYN